MTDTPRTEAELLTIFADNQNHGITAQDMRDYVKSTSGKLDKAQAFSMFAYGQDFAVASGSSDIPYDTSLYAGTEDSSSPGWVIYDPNGMMTTSSDPTEPYGGRAGGYYLQGIPKNSVWCTQFTVGFKPGTFTEFNAIQVVTGFPSPDFTPTDISDDTASGVFGFPTYAYGGLSAQYFGQEGTQHNLWSGIATLPFYDDDRVTTWNLGPPQINQNSGATQHLSFIEIDVWRIA